MYYFLVNSHGKKGCMGSTFGCKPLLGTIRSTKSKLLSLKAKHIIQSIKGLTSSFWTDSIIISLGSLNAEQRVESQSQVF